MRFSKYLSDYKLTDQAMADKLGCDRSYVAKLRGMPHKVPSPEMIRKIAEITDGAVQFDDWFQRRAAA